MSTHTVFTYGTLMRGHGNHRLIEGRGTFAGSALTVARATLHDVGAFPAISVIGKGPSWVVGEMFHVNDHTLADLDRLEGVPRLYTRERTTVIDKSGAAREVWIYVWASDRSPGPVIASGCWETYRHESGRRIR